MVAEAVALAIAGVLWDIYREKKTQAKFDQLFELIESMSTSEVHELYDELGVDFDESELEGEVLEWIDEHHDTCGLFDMDHEQLLGLVDTEEWDNLVFEDNDCDLTYWHGHHIDAGDPYDASLEDLLEFHKWAYYWRIMTP